MRQTERFGPCPVLRFCIWATVGQPLRTALQGRPGGGGGSGIPVYPKKTRQNTPKYPKVIQVYPGIFSGILYT